jgi:hypothetical protein
MLANGDGPQFYERKSHEPILLKSNRPPANSFTSLDAYAGMRYWFVDLDLRLDATGTASSQLLGLSQAGTLAVAKSGALQWVDPVVGLRAR